MTNTTETKSISQWFDQAGSLRPAAILFAGLAIAALLESLLWVVESPSLAALFLALALGWGVLVRGLVSTTDLQRRLLEPWHVALLMIAVLVVKRQAFGGPTAYGWPSVGLLVVLVATALISSSPSYGPSWYSGRALFVVFGAVAVRELILDVAARWDQVGGASVTGVRLAVAGILAYATVEESYRLYRSWTLFRRIDR